VFIRFSFLPRNVQIEDIPGVIQAMFKDLGLLKKFRIEREVLARFILVPLLTLIESVFINIVKMVRRGYRDPPYHNWSHAFGVAHFCYLLVKNLKLSEKKLLR